MSGHTSTTQDLTYNIGSQLPSAIKNRRNKTTKCVNDHGLSFCSGRGHIYSTVIFYYGQGGSGGPLWKSHAVKYVKSLTSTGPPGPTIPSMFASLIHGGSGPPLNK